LTGRLLLLHLYLHLLQLQLQLQLLLLFLQELLCMYFVSGHVWNVEFKVAVIFLSWKTELFNLLGSFNSVVKRMSFWSREGFDIYGQAASNLVAGSNLEGTIQQIIDMGGGSWDRDTVVRALRAAYNNPERAVEYLYSVCGF